MSMNLLVVFLVVIVKVVVIVAAAAAAVVTIIIITKTKEYLSLCLRKFSSFMDNITFSR